MKKEWHKIYDGIWRYGDLVLMYFQDNKSEVHLFTEEEELSDNNDPVNNLVYTGSVSDCRKFMELFGKWNTFNHLLYTCGEFIITTTDVENQWKLLNEELQIVIKGTLSECVEWYEFMHKDFGTEWQNVGHKCLQERKHNENKVIE